MSSGFPEIAQRLMAERGISLRALARQAHCDASHLSRVLRGLKPCSDQFARSLDAALNAGGALVDAARAPALLPDRDLGGFVTPELVGYFRAQLAGHYTADMYLGPRYLIPVVQAEAELITRLAGEARDDQVRQGLLDAGTAYAAMPGLSFAEPVFA